MSSRRAAARANDAVQGHTVYAAVDAGPFADCTLGSGSPDMIIT